jgi:hypothetical protein
MYQIRIRPDGKWHRRQVGGDHEKTACGESLSGAMMSRDWELDSDLCEICFTKSERQTGDFQKLERDRDRFDDPDHDTDPDATPPPLPPEPSS